MAWRKENVGLARSYDKLTEAEKIIFIRTLGLCRYDWIHSAWQYADVSIHDEWRRNIK